MSMDMTKIEMDGALDMFCHPIGRVRALGFVVENANDDTSVPDPFEGYFSRDVYVIGSMLIDAAEDLKQLLDLAQKHQVRQNKEITRLKARIMDLESREVVS
jgi:D-arabinose 1-dehydrogenase-like Zn-dependent alcohol dehydrogenase